LRDLHGGKSPLHETFPARQIRFQFQLRWNGIVSCSKFPRQRSKQLALVGCRVLLASPQHNFDGGATVDVTMKVDVLAVCAALVFVGAIVLGAF